MNLDISRTMILDRSRGSIYARTFKEAPTMKAAEWIDRVKLARGWESDYRVAKELGFKANTISMYRAHGSPMDEGIALKVAAALGMNPAGIILDQAAERTKSPEVRSTLSGLANQLCALCKVAGQSACKRLQSFAGAVFML